MPSLTQIYLPSQANKLKYANSLSLFATASNLGPGISHTQHACLELLDLPKAPNEDVQVL